MKLLYLAPVYINDQKPDGVAKKVLNHVAEFSKCFDVFLMSYGDGEIVTRHGAERTTVKVERKNRRYALYEEVEKKAKVLNFDCAYIRYPKSERHFIHLVKKLSVMGAKIITEIPTYPYNGNATESLKTFAISILDSIYRINLKKYIQRIVTFSDDDVIFGIPTIKTINGIAFDGVEKVVHTDKHTSINLISVATNYGCHGFDRVIEGIEDYYAKGGKEDIRFRIVGDGPAIKDYRKKISQCHHLGGRIELNGFQTGENLKRLYDSSDIAVNSLALYRLNLKKESTLKTKEYIAKGLPIISSTVVDGLNDDGNKKYVLLFPDCGEKIEVEDIISFYHKIYDGRNADEVADEIRVAGQQICDMNVTMAPVIEFLLGDRK
ncbi:glycosyltransferase [Butyrivibrio fibrisolvens]|uniref:glycosyltransferase n=1 Tax=Butyrivibrio fibrisolvens TaxID=831 RepID=UPI00048506B4|nr:glycosyltransferase [Butyrivibrio fibrisolvens]